MYKVVFFVLVLCLWGVDSSAQDSVDYSEFSHWQATLCNSDSLIIDAPEVWEMQDFFNLNKPKWDWTEEIIALHSDSILYIYTADSKGKAIPEFEAPLVTLGIGLSGNAVVSSEGDKFRIYEYTPGGDLVELSSLDLPPSFSMTRMGSTFYLGSSEFLFSVDCADPAEPTLNWVFSEGGPNTVFANVEVIDSDVLAAIEYSWGEVCTLYLLDISNSNTVSILSVLEVPTVPLDIAHAGDCLGVTGELGGYWVDISQPDNPSLVPMGEGGGSSITCLDGKLVTSVEPGYLVSYDVSDPGAPLFASYLDFDVWSLFEAHESLMLGAQSGRNKYQLYTIKPDQGPEIIGQPIEFIGITSNDYEVENGVLAIARHDLELYPAPYTGESWDAIVPDVSGAWSVELRDHFAIVASITEESVIFVDIADPQDAQRISSVHVPGLTVDMEVSGNRLVVADSTSGVHLLDISDPYNPQYESYLPTSEPVYRVEISGDVAFIATGAYELMFIDISEPSSPSLLASFILPSTVVDITSHDGIAYIVTYEHPNGKLFVVNFRVSTTPELVREMDCPGVPTSIISEYPYLYVGYKGLGVHVYDIELLEYPTCIGGELFPGYGSIHWGEITDLSLIRIGDGYLFLNWAPFGGMPPTSYIYNYPQQYGEASSDETIHVPADQPTIQAGIDAASAGDTVVVACGTYTWTSEGTGDENGLVQLKSGVVLKSETELADCVVVDAEEMGSVLYGTALSESTKVIGITFAHSSGYCVDLAETENSISFVNCHFVENTSAVIACGHYGALVSSLELYNCEIIDNVGSAIRLYEGSVTIDSCLIACNGSALSMYHGGAHIMNSTITGNSASIGNSVSSTYLSNSILWANGGVPFSDPNEWIVISCSDIEGGWEGEGNIDEDPQFCDPGNGNYYLHMDSPCLPENNECGVLMGVLGEGDCAHTGTEEVPASDRMLLSAYPNPFNPQLTISFSLPSETRGTLIVLDVLGKRVRLLRNGQFARGVDEITWDGKDDQGLEVSSGVYFVRLEAAEDLRTKKVVLLR